MTWAEGITVVLTIGMALLTVLLALVGYVGKESIGSLKKLAEKVQLLEVEVGVLKASGVASKLEAHDGRIRTLENDLTEIRGDLKAIRGMLERVLNRDGNGS